MIPRFRLFRGSNVRPSPVDPTPVVPDTPEYTEAIKEMKAADRWLVAVMSDADRVFKPHRRKLRVP